MLYNINQLDESRSQLIGLGMRLGYHALYEPTTVIEIHTLRLISFASLVFH